MQFVPGFGSDNHSGIHPKIFSAIQAVNHGHCAAYGTDEYTLSVIDKMKKLFARDCDIHFVFNGTAANILSLSTFASSYHAILTASTAHLWVDECGAPEKMLGCKLITVESADGKLKPADLSKFMVRKGDQHSSQVIGISITQPTEYGTVYTLAEIEELHQFAKKHSLYLHMDGSRLVNAATSLNEKLSTITKNVDVLSLGGTKNGLLFGEAVVIFNKDLTRDFKFKRKQFMQLASKTRFVAAQFESWLCTDLWQEISKHSIAMAQKLRASLSEIRQVRMTQKTESNAVFAIFPKEIVHELKKHHFFYIWNEETFEARLMTSFDTKEADIDAFARKVRELVK